MKISGFKIIVLLGLVFLLFKQALSLRFLDLTLFFGYSVLFTVLLVLANYLWYSRYIVPIKLFVSKQVQNVHLMALYATLYNFGIIWIIGLGFKLFDTVVMGDENARHFIEHGGFMAVFRFTFALSILAFIYFDISFNTLSKDEQIEQQRVLTGNVSAQFESLKHQLDPHFLFNSLNVLNALIEENPEKAQEFTNALSKIYRYILDHKNKELVPLEDELFFAKTYIELLQMRFEDTLLFEIPDTVKQEGGKVVPLSLQLLLENVIKHNKATSSNPIKIVIKEESSGYLVVENNLNKKNEVEERRGIGLQNIVSRYELLTKKPILIEETTEAFSVKIPILTKKIEHMRILDVQENEQELLIEAKRKVERIKKFYGHLTSFIMVNVFLIFLNLITDQRFMWSLIITFSWGIGLVADYMKTYNYNFFLGSDWEDRKIREYMEKHKKDSNL